MVCESVVCDWVIGAVCVLVHRMVAFSAGRMPCRSAGGAIRTYAAGAGADLGMRFGICADVSSLTCCYTHTIVSVVLVQ